MIDAVRNRAQSFANIFIFIAIPLSLFSAKALVPLLIVITLLMFVANGKENIKKSFEGGVFIAAFIFLLYAIISSIWSVNEEYSLISALKIIVLSLVGFIFVNFCRKQQGGSFVYAFVLSIVIALFEFFSGGILTMLFRNMIGSSETVFDPYLLNRGVAFLAVFFWVVIAIKGRSFWSVTFFAAFLAVAIMSESMSAKLAFICSAIAFLVSYFSRGFLDYLMMGAVVILMIAAPIVSVVTYINISHEKREGLNIPLSAEHRLYIWKFSLEKTKENKMLGHGFNAARYVDGADEYIVGKEYMDWHNIPSHPHSNVIQLLLELGSLGLVLYMMVIITIFVIIKIRIRDDFVRASAIAMLISYLVVGMTGFGMWQEWWLVTAFFCAGFMVQAISSKARARAQN